MSLLPKNPLTLFRRLGSDCFLTGSTLDFDVHNRTVMLLGPSARTYTQHPYDLMDASQNPCSWMLLLAFCRQHRGTWRVYLFIYLFHFTNGIPLLATWTF